VYWCACMLQFAQNKASGYSGRPPSGMSLARLRIGSYGWRPFSTWLKSDKMATSDVFRAKKKHRYLMCLIRKVAGRKKGNGLKIPKFHGVLHMVDEILYFGVPLEFDTGDHESHHILAKVAAWLTQKIKENFEESRVSFNRQTPMLSHWLSPYIR